MKTNIYFEPPSRLQLLDKLKHLVRFSDFLLLISGSRGAGKSTILAQLQPEQSDTTLACCSVRPESEISPQKLLQHLSAQLPEHESTENDFAGLLTAFHNQLKAMRNAGRKCLILVDDAEYLSNDALELLLNLHAADAQLVLMSDVEYAESVMQNLSVKQMEGRVHQINIEGMSDEESLDYLQICHPAVSSLPDKKKAELIKLAEGMPGRIETLLAGGKVAPAYSSKKRTAFPLPPVHMAGIGVVLLGIVAVSLVQFMPDEPSMVQPESIERVSLPLPVAASEGDDAQEIALKSRPTMDPSPQAVVPKEVSVEPVSSAKTELANRLKAQEEKLAAEVQKAQPVAAKQEVVERASDQQQVEPKAQKLERDLRNIVENTPVVSKVEQELSPGAAPVVANKEPAKGTPSIVAEQSPKTTGASSTYSRYENALLGFSPKSYTLQLLGARSKSSATEFISKHGGGSQFYYFSTVYKGAPWHVVVYGNYANRDVANASIRKLPAALQKTKPWARSLQGVQLDIRKKK